MLWDRSNERHAMRRALDDGPKLAYIVVYLNLPKNVAPNMSNRTSFSRRTMLGILAAPLIRSTAQTQAHSIITKPIPSSGEALPVVGLGSWITFQCGQGYGRA